MVKTMKTGPVCIGLYLSISPEGSQGSLKLMVSAVEIKAAGRYCCTQDFDL